MGQRAVAMIRWMREATEQEVHEYAHNESPRCPVCGRVEASDDCEPDPALCWHALRGEDRHCDWLRTEPDANDLAIGRRDPDDGYGVTHG